jgi:hypothetical protein
MSDPNNLPQSSRRTGKEKSPFARFVGAVLVIGGIIGALAVVLLFIG